jgi:hypothetical protein
MRASESAAAPEISLRRRVPPPSHANRGWSRQLLITISDVLVSGKAVDENGKNGWKSYVT